MLYPRTTSQPGFMFFESRLHLVPFPSNLDGVRKSETGSLLIFQISHLYPVLVPRYYRYLHKIVPKKKNLSPSIGS